MLTCGIRTVRDFALATFATLALSVLTSAAHAAVDVNGLIARLNAAGYAVQRGRLAFSSIDACRDLPSCWGNNPSSPYGFYALPPAPGEYRGAPALQTAGDLWATWRLRPDEAVVFVGRTPPECRYFSFRTYLFTRDAGGGARKTLFASLADAVNQLRIGTTGTPRGAVGVPFDKEAALVTTADAGAASIVAAALVASGLQAGAVNVDPLATDVPLRLGLDAAADELGMIVRTAMPTDAARMNAYLAAPPCTVLRLTPIGLRRVAPLAPAGFAARGTGQSEAQILPGLPAALDELERAVARAHGAHGVRKLAALPATPLAGPLCIQYGYNCLGDNQDTTYQVGAPFVLSGTTGFVTVVGVNHRALAKAGYINVSVYNAGRQLGLAAANDLSLAGSALRYLPAHPLAPYLYVARVSRACAGDPTCLQVDTAFPGAAPEESLVIAERAYLEPATEHGPAYGELLAPRVLQFGR